MDNGDNGDNGFVVVSPPEGERLPAQVVARVQEITGYVGEARQVGESVWWACARAVVAEALAEARRERVDVNLLAELRPRRLLVADMDSTIVAQETLDEVARAVGKAEQVAEQTRQAMAGKMGFQESLRQRLAILASSPRAVWEDVAHNKLHIRADAQALVQTMQAQGGRAVLVSGGFHTVADVVAKKLGFDAVHANTLTFDSAGTLRTGTTHLDGMGKVAACMEHMEAMGIGWHDVVAVGDGANDVPLLQKAGLGVAFRPHEICANATSVHVRHGTLGVLLALQGLALMAEHHEAHPSPTVNE